MPLRKYNHPRNCFLADGIYHFKIMRKGKIYKCTLETDDRDLAEAKAVSLRQHVINGTWRERLAENNPCDTVEDLCRCFEGYVNASDLQPRTPQGYKAAMLRLLARIYPNDDIERLELSVFDAKLVSRYQEIRLEEARPKGPLAVNDALISSHTEINNMKGMFSAAALQSTAYEPLNIDLQLIREMKERKIKRGRSKRFQLPPQDILDRIESDLKELKKSHPGRWLAAMLCGNVGLRREEGIYARQDQFVANTINGDRAISYKVMITEDRNVKGSQGSVPVDASVYDQIMELLDWPVYILPGHKSAREEVYRQNAAWLRDIGWQAKRPNHELRKLFGAHLATHYDIFTAQLALRHSNPKITSDLYADIINNNRTVKVIAGN